MRLLLVEDGRLLASLVSKASGRAWHEIEVISAHNGTDARYLSYAKQPDVVMIDWQLADGSGPLLCSEISYNLSRVPVLVVTDSDAAAAEAMARGAYQTIDVPVLQERLMVVLQDAFMVNCARKKRLHRWRQTKDDFNRLLRLALEYQPDPAQSSPEAQAAWLPDGLRETRA